MQLVLLVSGEPHSHKGPATPVEGELSRRSNADPGGRGLFDPSVNVEIVSPGPQRQTAARTPAAPRPARATTTAPAQVPFPFRLIGAELRAGQRAVSIAPATDPLSAGQIQVLLPGEHAGRWQLQTIDGNTAVFQAGDQTRRLAIP